MSIKTKHLMPYIIGAFILFFNSNITFAQFVGAEFSYRVHKTVLVDSITPKGMKPMESLAPPADPLAPIKFKLTLNLYFNCDQEDLFQEQPITIHEHIAQHQTAELNLKLDSISSTKTYLNVACETANEQCLKTATYSAIIELDKLEGGYDITWGTCCWDMSIKNLDNLKMQGLAMIVHIPFPADQSSNSSPVFSAAPQVLTCPQRILNINSSAQDSDGDQLTYKLIHPFSYEQENNFGKNKQKELFPGQNTHTPLVVGRPPFKKLAYAKGDDANTPLGTSQRTLNKESGTMDLKPMESGKYLIGVSVLEYRNSILLGETQRVFIIEVVTDTDSEQIKNNI